MTPSFTNKRFKPSSGAYQLFMLVLCLYALVALAIGAWPTTDAGTKKILSYADTAICVPFFIDFVASFVRSRDRWRYMYTWGWIDLLSSIPVIPFVRWGRVARVVRIFRLLRAVRATKTISSFMLEKRAQSVFAVAALLAILFVFVGSIAILQFETTPTSTIHTPEEAIWWAVETMANVDYGDRRPVTTEGRVVAALLMIVGAGLFGVLAGSVAAWFLGPTQKKEESEIAQMRDEITRLRRAIEDSRSDRSP